MEAFGVLVHELVFVVLDKGALDLIGGLEAQRHLHAIGNAAHIHLGHRCALAGMDALDGDNDPEFAVYFDDIAFSQRAGDDFHGFLKVCLNSGRNILILSLTASYFVKGPQTRLCPPIHPVPRPSGLAMSMPTGGRRSWRACRSWQRYAPGSWPRVLSRSRPVRL